MSLNPHRPQDGEQEVPIFLRTPWRIGSWSEIPCQPRLDWHFYQVCECIRSWAAA